MKVEHYKNETAPFFASGRLSVEATKTLCATVVTDDAGFDALEQEWDSLLEESEQRVYFLRWGWTRAWWRAFKPAGSRLMIIVCRDGEGQMVGLAPLYVAQRRTAGIPHVRELMFLGTGIYAQTSEYLDLIARRRREREVAETVVRHLQTSSEWDRLWLNEIPSASTVFPYFHTALGLAAQVEPCNHSHHIDTTTDWETFCQSLSRSTRKHLTRQMRRFLEKRNWEFQRICEAQDLEPAMDALVRLHQARWTSKGEPGSFALPGVEALLREAAQRALAGGQLRLWTLKLDDEIVAVRLAFFDKGIVHAFQGGFDPVYAKDSLGSVMLGLCIKDCLGDAEVREYDFMGGTDSYKDWWTKSGRETVTLTCLRSGIRSLAYASIGRATRAGRSLLRATVPQSLRKVGYRLLERRHYSK
ncbi:MAG TPA: GNAT family N-acetyltransferase [Blastocatellia bacterium]|nr:GNAT family N-acetyltransferase [Blastocatellia bacterium]